MVWDDGAEEVLYLQRYGNGREEVMATTRVRDGKEVHEIALLQVQIDGKWRTWSRIEKGYGEQWDGQMLVKLSEQIPRRIVFEKPHKTGDTR